jgi:hypothetical protein
MMIAAENCGDWSKNEMMEDANPERYNDGKCLSAIRNLHSALIHAYLTTDSATGYIYLVVW